MRLCISLLIVWCCGTVTAEQRVHPIAIEDMTSEQKALIGYEEGKALPGRARSNLFRTLLHHPELTSRYTQVGDRVFRAPELDAKDRELIILRIAQLYESDYEWGRHVGPALKAGWTPEDIGRVHLGAADPAWSDFERTLLLTTDQLVNNAYIEDAQWNELQEKYSVQDIMVLITMVTHYHWVAMMTRSLGVELEDHIQVNPRKSVEQAKRVASVSFVEGPTWRADGSVLFSDIPNNRIMRWEPGSPPRIHRQPSFRANGLLSDANGNLIITETDGRVVKEFSDGTIRVLADSYEGVPFNSPNDLAMDTAGRIYFTDPAYRTRPNAPQRDNAGNVIEGVYRIDRSGKITRLIAHEVAVPNGILVSPKDEYLYVAENDNRPGGPRGIFRFDLATNGDIDLQSRKMIFDFGTERGPDGMTIDSEGNLYVTAGLNRPQPGRTNKRFKAGIYVISPSGELMDFIAVPVDSVTNVTFGGMDGKTLYITAGNGLWTAKTERVGYWPH